MSDLGGSEEVGARIRQRRTALGISAASFAKRAHVDRDTLRRIEEGQEGTRAPTLAAIDRALSDLEEEMGMDDPEPARGNGGLVAFKIEGVYGAARIVVEGPIENIAELQEAVDHILRNRAPGTDPEG